jgi:hypothetical protein
MVENSMSEKDEMIFMQPLGEDAPREVNVFDLIPLDVPVVDEEKRKLRMDICKGCDKFQHSTLCVECGCFMPTKTWMIDARCPLEKWD